MGTPAWYADLLACRKAKQPFTASDVRVPSPRLAKFVDWKYLRRAGARAGAKRWERLFEVTRWGRKKNAPQEARGKYGVPARQ